jgi:hypothetical protein
MIAVVDAQDTDLTPDLVITVCGRRYSPLVLESKRALHQMNSDRLTCWDAPGLECFMVTEPFSAQSRYCVLESLLLMR